MLTEMKGLLDTIGISSEIQSLNGFIKRWETVAPFFPRAVEAIVDTCGESEKSWVASFPSLIHSHSLRAIKH